MADIYREHDYDGRAIPIKYYSGICFGDVDDWRFTSPIDCNPDPRRYQHLPRRSRQHLRGQSSGGVRRGVV